MKGKYPQSIYLARRRAVFGMIAGTVCGCLSGMLPFAARSAWAAEFGFVDKVVRGAEAVPVSICTNRAGNTLVDFGRHGFGWLEACVSAPGEYEFTWGEMIDASGSVVTDELHTKKEGWIRCATAKGSFGGTGWTRIPYEEGPGSSFHPGPVGKFGRVMPFRWLEVKKSPFGITAANVRQVPVYYPYDMSVEAFSCDSDALVRVHDFCKHTVRATTYTGKFIDGDRERLPYEGDSYITLLSTYAITSDETLAHPMVDYLAVHTTWPTEWKQFFIRLVYEDWMHSGRTDLIRRHYALMRDVKSWRHLRRPDGLLATAGPKATPAPDGSRPRDIVDWAKCYRDGFVFCEANAVVNALHYRNLVELGEMAGAIGERGDAEMFAAEARQTFDSYQRVFFDAPNGRYRDGEGTDHATVQANAMAIACGVVPAENLGRVSGYVAAKGFSCSTYMTQFVLEALFLSGKAREAIGLMSGDGPRSWIAMMERGATVTREFWDLTLKERGRVPDMSHAWSTAPLNMISRYVLGVKPAKPGAAAISVRPNPGGLNRLSGRVPTVKGVVGLSLSRTDGAWDVTLATPVPAEFEFLGTRRSFAQGRHSFSVLGN